MTDKPAYPVVEGEYQMTETWSVHLPEKLQRRFEDDAMVLWRPGFTAWVIVFENDDGDSRADRLADIRGDVSPGAFDVLEEEGDGLLRFSYRLAEEPDDGRRPGFHAFALGDGGHVQLAVYFNDEQCIDEARALWRGLREHQIVL